MTSISGFGLSSTGITFNGLASGLDTQAIIQALLAVEQRPITRTPARRSICTSRRPVPPAAAWTTARSPARGLRTPWVR